MKNKSCSFKNGFFFIIMLIAVAGFSQNSPCLPHKAGGYTLAEISEAYKADKLQCEESSYEVKIAEILQADADAQGVKFKPEYGGGPAKFSSQPGFMDSVFKYSIIQDDKFTSNYGWDPDTKKFVLVARDPYEGEKAVSFDYNKTPYFEGSYKPAHYASTVCFNPQTGEKPSLAKTTNTVTNGNTTTTTTTEKTPEGDVNVTVINTNTNTNTNTAPATPPSNMLPTQSYSQGSSYCVADGMYYPQGNSQGQWCQQSNGQMIWVDWVNLFLNAADLAVDIWSLWKLYDLAGTPETVIPPTVYNYYIEEGDITYNYYGDDEDPTGDDDPDLPGNGDGGIPDLGENGKLASQSGKSSNPFGGEMLTETTKGNAVNNDGNIFGGSVSTSSPNVEVNQTIAGNVFGAGVSTPNTGIVNTSAVLNNGIASVSPLNTSTSISNPFGASAVAIVETGNLSGVQVGGITGIKNPVNIGTNQIVLNPSTNLPITNNVVGQSGVIAINGVPGTNGIQMVNTGTGISGTQGTGIQMIQTDAVAINGNIGGNGIKPITLIDQPTAINLNQGSGGIDKNIVASQQQYSIGSILTGGATTTGTGTIPALTGTGIKMKSAGLGTGGLVGIKIK